MAASPEVNVPDVQVTKSARHGSRRKRSISNDPDLEDPLYTGPATTSTVTVTTTADNSHSGSDTSSNSISSSSSKRRRRRMASDHQSAIGDISSASGGGGGGANHNKVGGSGGGGGSPPFSTLSPIRRRQQQQQQQHGTTRHSRQESDLAAETAEVGASCFPNSASTLSILAIQPQQTATSLDTDARRMGEASNKDGRGGCNAASFEAAAAKGENSAFPLPPPPPFSLIRPRLVVSPSSSSSTPMPHCSSPLPPLLPLPSPAAPSRRRSGRILHANHESPQLDYPRRHLADLAEASSPAPVARAFSHSHFHRSAVDNSSSSNCPSSPLYHVRPPALLESAMSCVASSVVAPTTSAAASTTTSTTTSALAGGSILAAKPACNPSVSAPLSVPQHSPLAQPLASVKPTLPQYSVNFSLPPGTTTTATSTTPAAFLRTSPLQLFVAHIAGGLGSGAASVSDPGIDIDIDMDGDLRSGEADQNSDSGDHYARASEGRTAGDAAPSPPPPPPRRGSSSARHDRPPPPMSLSSSSAGVLAEVVTAPGSQLLLPPQPVHGHSLLSDSQISPIRSLTAALALSQSPSQSPPPQAGLASAVAAAQSFRPPPPPPLVVDASGAQHQQQQEQELLLLKVDDIQRLCESLVQVQAQQAQKIRSLEATVRRLSDVSSPPSSHHQPQQHQRETMPSLAAAAVASSGGSRRLSHLPPIQASMTLPPNMAQHRAADDMAEEGSAQWLDPLRPPQPTAAYQQSHGAFAGVASERRAAAQTSSAMDQQHQHEPLLLPPPTAQYARHHHHHHHQSQPQPQPQQQAPPAFDPPPTSLAGLRHQHQHHHLLSPKMARQLSPLPLAAAAAGGGSSSLAHSQRHHHRSLGSGSAGSSRSHQQQQQLLLPHQMSVGSAGRSRRGSSSAAHAMAIEGSRGAVPALHAAPSGLGGGQQRQQQQQHYQGPQFSASSSRRASVGPSAFGYPAAAAAASGSATAMADAGLHYGGGGGQAGALLPALAPGHPSMRMKRPRDAESGDEFSGAEAAHHGSAPASAAGAAPSTSGGDATLSHTPPVPMHAYSLNLHLARHSHPHHSHPHPHHQAMLPPIRTSDDAQHWQMTSPPGSSSSAPPLRLAAGSVAGGGGSLHLVSPSAIGFAHGGGHSSDSKGKGVASGGAAADSTPSARPVRGGGGNRDAQPTHSWLASQRHYKSALLHLLSLESFYPSDIAMLNMFRALGDFTPDQVEIYGPTLLSWARGWLRYSRNAVLRSTLDNKAKEPVKLLAEALQHDLHAEVDFTTPANLRRCTLLRLIYFQWQSINKLGTKSQSMYRDYESRLREIDALPTFEDQEREWESILKEEQQRRLEIIRESRMRSDSNVQPRTKARPEQMYQSKIQMTVAAPPPPPPPPPPQPSISAPASASVAMGQASEMMAHGTSAMQQLSLSRRQSADWFPTHPSSAQSPTPGPSHYHYSQQLLQQHYQGPPFPPPAHLHYRPPYHPAQPPPPPPPPPPQYLHHISYRHHHQHHSQPQTQPQQMQQQQQQIHHHYRSRELVMREPPDGSGGMQADGVDNDSEMSVNLSPEP